MVVNDEIVFKIYNNNSDIKIRKYEFKKLHNFTKFARMEAWGAKLTRKYNNVYVSNNHEDKRWVYYIDSDGGWHGGADKKKSIVTDEFKYKVYDIVNGKMKYDIPRIENMSDNSQIRFRLTNDRKNGLNLCLYTIKDDLELKKVLIMRQTTMEKYKLSCVCWSSEQYTIDIGYEGMTCQEFTFSQMN